MITLRPLQASQAHLWNALVDAHPDGTLFHTWEWLHLMESFQPGHVERLGFFREGQLIGVFPLTVARRFGLRVAGSPLYFNISPYLGPLLNDMSATLASLDHIADYLAAHRIQFCRIFFTRDATLPSGRWSPWFRVIGKHTHLLALDRPIEALWQQMDSSRRRVLRKAEKAGLTIVHTVGEEQIDEYFSVATALYR